MLRLYALRHPPFGTAAPADSKIHCISAIHHSIWMTTCVSVLKYALWFNRHQRFCRHISLGDAQGHVLASMSGSASSASLENLKPHVNSSPQNRTCRACFAPIFIARLWVGVCLMSRRFCQASMQRAEARFSAWRRS